MIRFHRTVTGRGMEFGREFLYFAASDGWRGDW